MTKKINMDIQPKEELEKSLATATKLYLDRKNTPNELSIRKAAKLCGINNWEALRGRIGGSQARSEYAKQRQKLSPIEEDVLVS